jgi:hypothetical protein
MAHLKTAAAAAAAAATTVAQCTNLNPANRSAANKCKVPELCFGWHKDGLLQAVCGRIFVRACAQWTRPKQQR